MVAIDTDTPASDETPRRRRGRLSRVALGLGAIAALAYGVGRESGALAALTGAPHTAAPPLLAPTDAPLAALRAVGARGASAQLETLRARFSNTPEDWRAAARALAAVGALDAADAAYARAAPPRSHTGDGRALGTAYGAWVPHDHAKARFLMDQGRWTEAAQLLEPAWAWAGSQDAGARAALAADVALTRLRLGAPERALDAVARVRADGYALEAATPLRSTEGAPVAAETVADPLALALALSSLAGEARIALGAAGLAGMEHRTAAALAEAYGAEPPLAARLARGLARVRLGEVEAGLAEIRAVVDRRIGWAEAWRALGVGLDAAGDMDGAARAFARAARLNPDDVELRARAAAFEATNARPDGRR